MNDWEQIAQVAQEKRATVSELLRSLMSHDKRMTVSDLLRLLAHDKRAN